MKPLRLFCLRRQDILKLSDLGSISEVVAQVSKGAASLDLHLQIVRERAKSGNDQIDPTSVCNPHLGRGAAREIRERAAALVLHRPLLCVGLECRSNGLDPSGYFDAPFIGWIHCEVCQGTAALELEECIVQMGV